MQCGILKLAVLVATLGLGGCGSCLNVYSDDPVGMRSSKVVAHINGKRVARSAAQPIPVTGIKVWLNYETSGLFTGRGAAIYVNGAAVKSIVYANQKGFKSTGVVDLGPALRLGINKIEVRILYGKTASGVTLMGARRMEALPAGGAAHQCFSDDQPAREVDAGTFEVDYRPSVAFK